MASFNRVHGPQSSVLIVLLAMSLITFASSDYASDRAECADQVIKLSTCLTYMQGSARAPTPDCCSSLKQVVDKSFKCLCILVKDRNEPELASFKVNVTFALRLPSKCGVPANASACPRLLNLPPNSPDAKIFEEYGNMTSSDAGASDGTASMSTRAGGWRTEAGAGLWSLSLLLLVLLSVLGC
uniref:Protein YLS3 isoform X1 n=1 Tax=Elaeis guineensis var. tenera TaxID=51953 RepID=A0A6I9RY97_ELAGV|nr:protein YLS3 isoform X1 [Elaeis guineensis]